MKILVCDDEYVPRLLVKQYLSQYSVEILEAADAETALDKIEKEKPDIIILDYSMPGMTGLELLERIPRDIPAIMLTSEGYTSEIKEKLLSLAAIYLTKPLFEDDLLDAIEKIKGIKLKKK